MSDIPTLEQLMEAGAHFGHIKKKWHPKMEPYIFTVRNNTHIINLEKTQECLKKAQDYMQKLIATPKGSPPGKGKTILFVGTKGQTKEAIKKTAEALKMPYVDLRWLGGTLTNFETVRKALKKFEDLEKQKQDKEFFKKLTKKEQKNFNVRLEKMEKSLGGIREMKSLPDVLFVADTVEEKVTVEEANKLGIPLVAIVDSNSDPSKIDYPIPANDNSKIAVQLILDSILTACQKQPKNTKSTKKAVKKAVKDKKETKEKVSAK